MRQDWVEEHGAWWHLDARAGDGSEKESSVGVGVFSEGVKNLHKQEPREYSKPRPSLSKGQEAQKGRV